MKQSKVVAIILGALAVIFITTTILVFILNEDNRENYENSVLEVEYLGTTHPLEFENLQTIGLVDFQAIYDTSNTISGTVENYKGLQIKSLLAALGVDLQNIESIECTASDGMIKSYSGNNVKSEGVMYITTHREGELLTRKHGGPYMVIKADDNFSQDRCKYLAQITVNVTDN